MQNIANGRKFALLKLMSNYSLAIERNASG